MAFIEYVQHNKHQVALKALDAKKLHEDTDPLINSIEGAGRDKILIRGKCDIEGSMVDVLLQVTAFCSLHKQMLI